jgi:hypothetical protein
LAVVYVTKQGDSSIAEWRDRPAPTPLMIEAGVEALCEMPFGANPASIVERVWLAMFSEIPGLF